MALVKPEAQSINSFDADKQYTFYFNVNGGSQVIGNILTIKRRIDNYTVYKEKVETYSFSHTIPPKTLVNDEQYVYCFNTYDADDNISEDSNGIYFKCIKTPKFYFTNTSNDGIIESNSYKFTVQYQQEKDELIDGIIFYLYDEFGTELTSQSYLGTDVNTLGKLSHTFNGFENNTIYNVKATVYTVSGLSTSTETYRFTARYSFQDEYKLLELENDCKDNCVKVHSNVVVADGHINPIHKEGYRPWLNADEIEKCIEWDKLYKIGELYDEIEPPKLEVVNIFTPTLRNYNENNISIENFGDGTYRLNGCYEGSQNYIDITLGTITIPKSDGYKFIVSDYKDDQEKRIGRARTERFVPVYEGQVINPLGHSFNGTVGELYTVYIRLYKNVEFSDYMLKPMITTNGKATFDDFVRSDYVVTYNKQVTVEKSENIFKPTLGTQTYNGVDHYNNPISCTISPKDGGYRLSGTVPFNTVFEFGEITLEEGNYNWFAQYDKSWDTLFVVNLSNDENTYTQTNYRELTHIAQGTYTLSAKCTSEYGITILDDGAFFRPTVTTNVDITYETFVPYSETTVINYTPILTYDPIYKEDEEIAPQVMDELKISEWTTLLLDIHEQENYVEWTEGFSVKSDFTFSLFMKDGVIGRFIQIGDPPNNGYMISMIRGVPIDYISPRDCLELRGYVDGKLKVLKRSNYVDIINQLSYYYIWIKKQGNDYELKLDVFERGESEFNWIQLEELPDYIKWGELFDMNETFESPNLLNPKYPMLGISEHGLLGEKITNTNDSNKLYGYHLYGNMTQGLGYNFSIINDYSELNSISKPFYVGFKRSDESETEEVVMKIQYYDSSNTYREKDIKSGYFKVDNNVSSISMVGFYTKSQTDINEFLYPYIYTEEIYAEEDKWFPYEEDTVIEKTSAIISEWYEGRNWAYVPNNLDWERTTDKTWFYEEEYPSLKYYLPTVDKDNEMESVFPINKIRLYSGLYDHMDITSTLYDYPKGEIDIYKGGEISLYRLLQNIQRGWDYYTRLNCDFDDNICGGNIDIKFAELRYMRIKRRKKGTFDWLTIKEIEINDYNDLVISFEDYYVPTNYEAEYALVPTLEGGVEYCYIMADVNTHFNAFTIADNDKAFNLRAEVTYGGDTRNTTLGTYQPLSGLYPIIQSTSDLNYDSGSVTFTMLGEGFDDDRRIDRFKILKQTNDLISYLTDMKAKVIKDWNGMIRIVRFNGQPTTSYVDSSGNAVIKVTAQWVEQGKFDNQEDLERNGLL